jgi:arylsulfatase A-like enzyme
MKKLLNSNRRYRIVIFLFFASLMVFANLNFSVSATPTQNNKPNILWIIAEDQSPHISCYGEKTITTPHLDKMAAEGLRFDNAFVTSPVCSPSRSVMVTGMYQTLLGVHNHRSQRKLGNRNSNSKPYADTYVLPVPSVWEMFEANGYYVCNDGKSDYNWSNQILYNKGTWEKCREGQPFFAQIQLKGGKVHGGRERMEYSVSLDNVDLPPYYPDIPLFREWWADYLDSWLIVDKQVGKLMERLKQEELLNNTIIFFITDHGISSLRGKQYLYDEGISVPLIVRFPDKRMAGTVRKDMV